MDTLRKDDIVIMIRAVRSTMEEQRDHLLELDAAMGDGDLGLTMVKAFVAADEFAASSDLTDLGKLLMQIGMTMARVAPSTMGTLVATGFMRGGKALAGKESIDGADLAAFLRAFADGIKERGKTEVGNKTILDVMHPAATAAEQAAAGLASPAGVLGAASGAAQVGWEEAKGMQAQHGRQAYYREQSIGKADPGATAGLFIIQAMLRAVQSGE
ncbi:MAG: dihydroxyacetone kinase subunit L [Spirochaetales bacterium]|nr:dihydroxyacetone kinase subunit L [Spirochaetales bacterium]